MISLDGRWRAERMDSCNRAKPNCSSCALAHSKNPSVVSTNRSPGPSRSIRRAIRKPGKQPEWNSLRLDGLKLIAGRLVEKERTMSGGNQLHREFAGSSQATTM